ncbi:MAG: response regulator [Planctomycetota bacterium]
MRFLIVDDDPAIVMLLDNLIFKLGHEAVTCFEAAEVEAVQGEVHGAIVDWHLGDVTCEEVTLRLQEQFPGIPMMMITGASDLNLIQTALKLGVNDWWYKPTGIPKLKRQLQHLITEAAQRRSQDTSSGDENCAA